MTDYGNMQPLLNARPAKTNRNVKNTKLKTELSKFPVFGALSANLENKTEEKVGKQIHK
jgi:hypothetical protein